MIDGRPTTITETDLVAWSRAVTGAVASLAALLVVASVAFTDLEAVALVLVLAVVVVLRRRFPSGTDVALGIMFLNMAFWIVPGAIHNVTGQASVLVVALQTALGATAVVGITGLVAIQMRAPDRLARVAVALAAAAAVVATATAALGDDDEVGPDPDDLQVATRDTRFVPEHLETSAGPVAVHLRNDDFFWHTFSIPDLGVSLWVPVGAAGRVRFDAPPGTWAYTCEVPGHNRVMQGELVVRP